MTRFNATATLKSVEVTYNTSGDPSENTLSKDVYVNKFTVGASSFFAARAAGLKADAEIQLRSLEYSGQQRVSMDGIEYEVERVTDEGEYTRLSLAKRSNNG